VVPRRGSQTPLRRYRSRVRRIATAKLCWASTLVGSSSMALRYSAMAASYCPLSLSAFPRPGLPASCGGHVRCRLEGFHDKRAAARTAARELLLGQFLGSPDFFGQSHEVVYGESEAQRLGIGDLACNVLEANLLGHQSCSASLSLNKHCQRYTFHGLLPRLVLATNF